MSQQIRNTLDAQVSASDWKTSISTTWDDSIWPTCLDAILEVANLPNYVAFTKQKDTAMLMVHDDRDWSTLEMLHCMAGQARAMS